MGAIAVGMAAAAGAQQAVSPDLEAVEREAQRRQQEYLERLRRSTLVGVDDGLAIELPDGELIPLGRRGGCMPPVARGGLVKVDCTVWDGPAYYFDASTRAMVESCSFWFPEPRRCPPKQWPVDVPGCDAALPQSITGTWKLYAVPAAGGFSPVPNGWTMTLTDESITFAIDGFAPVRRAYVLLERAERRYALELRDALSATTRIDVELAPCGLFVESERICDAFCENLADEVGVPTAEDIREAAGRMSGGQSEESIERMIAAIRESIEQGPQPIFLERSFFAAESARRALD
jgi:hypothetical protein